MNENDMHELNLVELDLVNGGTRLMWQALYMIFNGKKGFDDMKINESAKIRINLAAKIEALTGIKLDDYSPYFVDRDIKFTMKDGTILNEDQFLDYIKETYSMDEILSWHLK